MNQTFAGYYMYCNGIGDCQNIPHHAMSTLLNRASSCSESFNAIPEYDNKNFGCSKNGRGEYICSDGLPKIITIKDPNGKLEIIYLGEYDEESEELLVFEY